MSDASKAQEALLRGETARREKRLDDAAADFGEAVAAFRTLNDPPRLAHALSRRAQIARDVKDWPLALRLQEEAVSLIRELEDRSALPNAVRHLADILQDSGQPQAAAPLYAEMMALYRAAPDTSPLEMANAARSLACNVEALGDRAGAVARWQDVRRQYDALDEVFRDSYGLAENPGVIEADRRLAALAAGA